MLHQNPILRATAVAIAAIAFATPASAARPFYKGKTLTVIINYAAGGNTDIQGRSVMRYMGDHIAGKPRVIIKNMAGAGGVVGTNYLGEAAKRNGSVMGVFTISIVPELMADPSLRVSHKKLVMIGAIGQQEIAHIRKDVAPGVNKPTDILKVTEVFKTAGHAPNNSKDMFIATSLGLLGIKHKHVTGFKSAGAIRRAILQNEIQYTEDSIAGYVAAVVPTLIKPGISTPLWQTGIPTEDGLLKRSPTVKDIPTFLEIYRAKYGKDARPKGIAWDTYLLLSKTRRFLRIICLPPGAPKAATEALRKAWVTTAKDPAFIAEYHKLNASDMEWLNGADAQVAIADLIDSITPPLRAHLRELAKFNR